MFASTLWPAIRTWFAIERDSRWLRTSSPLSALGPCSIPIRSGNMTFSLVSNLLHFNSCFILFNSFDCSKESRLDKVSHLGKVPLQADWWHSFWNSHSRWCHSVSTTKRLLQREHFWFLCLRFGQEDYQHRFGLLSFRRSIWFASRYLQHARLSNAMHRLAFALKCYKMINGFISNCSILEGEPQIVSDHFR